MKTNVLIAAALLSMTAISIGPSAEAATVVEGSCVSLWSWNFSPALSTSIQSGTVTVTGDNICGITVAQTAPIAAGVTPAIFFGQFSATYTGSCLLGTIDAGNGAQSFVLGGGAIVGVYNSGGFETVLVAAGVFCASDPVLTVVSYNIVSA